MDRFLSSLKKWLKSNRIEQEDLANQWGENNKNLSAYVTGRVRMPDHLRKRFEKLGYKGPWPKEEKESREGSAYSSLAALQSVAEPSPLYETRLLPWHIEEAWVIIHEAALKGGVDLMGAEDQRDVGDAIATIAQGVAHGTNPEGRMLLIRTAERLLLTVGKLPR